MKYLAIILTHFLSIHIYAQNFTDGQQLIGVTESKGTLWLDWDNDGDNDLFLRGINNSGQIISELYNNNNGILNNLMFNLPALSGGVSKIIYFNSDVFPDLIISGYDENLVFRCSLLINDGVKFELAPVDLPALSNGGIEVIDINQNGLPEIIFYGINSSGEVILEVLEIESGALNNVETNIPEFYDGNLQSTDINKDGYTDIFINGTSPNGGPFIQILKGKGGYHFEKEYMSIPIFLQSVAKIHDFNQDGLLDLIISGVLKETNAPKTNLYFGSTSGFVNSNSSLPDLAFGEIEILDFNNDGSSDLLLSGFNSLNQYQNIILESGADGNYSLNFSFAELRNGSLSPMDSNNDGNPEILLCGTQNGMRKTILYSNNSTPENSVSPPLQITANQVGETAIIKWNAPLSESNLGTQMNYRLQLTNQNGYLKYFTSHSNIYKINHLEEGTYELQIRSIDNANISSAYSEPIEFTICGKPDIGIDKSVCTGEHVQFETKESGDILWKSKNAGIMGADKVFAYKPTENDSIFLKIVKQNGCIVYDTALVTVNPLPQLSNNAKIESCLGSSVDLAPPSFPINTITSLQLGIISKNQSNFVTYEISSPDTLIFEATNEFGCAYKDSVFVVPFTLPSPETVFPKTIELCIGDTLTLNSPFDNTDWISALENKTVSKSDKFREVFLKSDIIEVKVTDENSCTNTSEIAIHVNPLPQFSLGPDLKVCFGDTLNLSTGLSYPEISWFEAGLKKTENTSIYKYVASTSGEVVSKIKNSLGCSYTDSIFIAVQPLPKESLNPSYLVCKDQSFEYRILNEYSKINWHSKLDGLFSTDNSISRVFTASDFITLSLRDKNGCENQYSGHIIVQETPLPELGEDLVLCKDEKIALGFGHDYSTIKWEVQNEFIASDSLKMTIIDSLDVYVTATDSLGCIYTDSIKINPISKPGSPFLSEATLCSNDTLTLQKHSNINITWLDELTAATIVDRPDSYHISSQSSDTIQFMIEEGNCINSSFIKLQVNQLEEFPLLSTYRGCEGDSIVLELPENWFVEWEVPGFEKISEPSITQFFDENTDITVKSRDSNLCFQENKIFLKANTLPLADAGENQLICSTQKVVIGPTSPNQNFQYQWSSNSGLSQNDIANPLAYPEKSTIYELKITDTNGCSSIDSVSVLLDAKTEIDLGNTYEICKGDSIALGGNPIASGSLLRYNYDWSPSENSTLTESGNLIVYPEKTTTYHVIISTGPCIIDTSFVEVIVHELPEINAGDDFTVGNMEWFQLEASGAVKYEWAPTQFLDFSTISNPRGQLSNAENFIVKGTDSNRCVGMDTVEVSVENKLFIPNIFTPNGDGINDFFTLRGFGIDEINFKIISSSGQVVFSLSEPEDLGKSDWDGRYQDRELPEGFYSWVITGYFLDKTLFFNEKISTGKLYLKR